MRGRLIGTTSRLANLGSNLGPWVIGGRIGSSTETFVGPIWDIRIATIERPLKWFEDTVARGQRFMGSWI